MRGRLALQKHFVRNARRRLFSFAKAFGVRTRFRVALVDSMSSSVDKRFGCGGTYLEAGKRNIVSSTGTLASTLSIMILCLSGAPLLPTSIDVGTNTPPAFS